MDKYLCAAGAEGRGIAFHGLFSQTISITICMFTHRQVHTLICCIIILRDHMAHASTHQIADMRKVIFTFTRIRYGKI